MATEYLDHSNIYSMGGYSGTPEQIAEQASREKNIPISLTIDDIKELSRLHWTLVVKSRRDETRCCSYFGNCS